MCVLCVYVGTYVCMCVHMCVGYVCTHICVSIVFVPADCTLYFCIHAHVHTYNYVYMYVDVEMGCQ